MFAHFQWAWMVFAVLSQIAPLRARTRGKKIEAGWFYNNHYGYGLSLGIFSVYFDAGVTLLSHQSSRNSPRQSMTKSSVPNIYLSSPLNIGDSEKLDELTLVPQIRQLKKNNQNNLEYKMHHRHCEWSSICVKLFIFHYLNCVSILSVTSLWSTNFSQPN